MFKPEQFQIIAEEILLKHHFEFSISWVMVGVNGNFFSGRFKLSCVIKRLKVELVSGRAKDLRFPINMLLVDKTGKAAHVCFKKSDGPIGLTNLQMGQA